MNVPTDFLDGYSEPNRCFVNVARAVRDFGGSAVMGWLVSEDDDTRTLIHHCVWRKPTGDLADISPQFDPDLTAASSEWKASIPPSVEFMQDESATLVEGRTRCMRHEARHPKYARMVEFLNRSERAFLAQDACGVNYWSERADREWHRAHGHKYDPRRPTVLRIGHQDTFGSYQPLRTELAGYLDPALGRPFYEQQTH